MGSLPLTAGIREEFANNNVGSYLELNAMLHLID